MPVIWGLPPQTLEDRELLTSRTADGKDYMAEWLWGKLEIDFCPRKRRMEDLALPLL